MLTDPNDVVVDVVDIFAGSNVTGWVCEHTNRQWLAFELDESYARGSEFRFEQDCPAPDLQFVGSKNEIKLRRLQLRQQPKRLETGEKRSACQAMQPDKFGVPSLQPGSDEANGNRIGCPPKRKVVKRNPNQMVLLEKRAKYLAKKRKRK